MSTQFLALVTKLKEIFQIDRPDLDFGVYRILNSRSREIEAFLTKRLKEKVDVALKDASENNGHNELKNLEEKLRGEFGNRAFDDVGELVNTEAISSDLGKRYLAAQKAPANRYTDESVIYQHLLTFFSRYYDDGDFISQRRYKGDTYAIPYAGEEVMLHWANKDQYYTKSGEQFSNYRIKLADGRTVLFRLVEADTARENRKDNDKNRCFSLIESPRTIVKLDEEGEEYEEILQPFEVINGELVVLFEYKAFPTATKQAGLNGKALEILQSTDLISDDWKEALFVLDPTEKDNKRSLIQKHLDIYSQKNTADYFIHKDLGKFLRNELDFYIKNEVMSLDDVASSESFSEIERQLIIIKILRKIGLEIISFLASLEDFQKKLWLKKKFVVSSDYSITLDRVDEKLYPLIVENNAQWDKWEELGFKDKAAKNWQTETYLQENQFMMLDTSLFVNSFKYQLINSIESLDEQTEGVIIRSDNFHGLSLLSKKYINSVKTIYIDPPFNLEKNGDFLYKTDYKDSSWLSMLDDRMNISINMLRDDGYFLTRCDINGNYLIRSLLDKNLGYNNFEAELLVQRIRKNITNQGKITLPLSNDSLFLYRKSESAFYINPYLELQKERAAYWRRIDDSAGFRNPPEREIFNSIFKPYKHDAHFKYSQQSIYNMIKDGRIRLRCQKCKYEHYEGDWNGCPECGSKFATPQYLVLASSTKVLDTNWLDIPGYSHTTGFSTENSEVLLDRVIELTTESNDIFMDYFSGSGTSIISSLKKQRKWIAIEQGDHCENIILPRISKKIKSLQRSYLYKYLSLESYEDTLNNLELVRGQDQKKLFENDKLTPEQKDDYLMHYMLNFESQGSILSVKDFYNPFDYTMKITVDSAGAYEEVPVDLIETFNYLIGLEVRDIDYKIERGYVQVTGTTRDGEYTTIIWRDCEKLSYSDLNALIEKLKINATDSEYDIIYINGDHNIANRNVGADGTEKTLKIRSIENDFMQLMFEEQ